LIDPNYTKALSRRAKAYENIGKLNESFEDLTALCILEKFSQSSMLLADKIVKKIGEKMTAEIFSVNKTNAAHKSDLKIGINLNFI
jgi:import receptor subunit TOM70